MSETNPSDPKENGTGPASSTLPRPLKLAVITASVLGAAAVLYGIGAAFFQPAANMQSASGPAGSAINQVDAAAKAAAALHTLSPPSLKGTGDMPPEDAFTGPDGKTVKLADFAGKVVVLNFWATWCPPCVKEMPTLAKLAGQVKDQPIAVVALSIDSEKSAEKAKAFIAEHAPLNFYRDASMTLPFKFSPPIEGYPTTVILDKTGRIRSIARGELDWTSPQVRKVLDKLAAE
jgi:thiol-disulfide isomerase/thioredoxin